MPGLASWPGCPGRSGWTSSDDGWPPSPRAVNRWRAARPCRAVRSPTTGTSAARRVRRAVLPVPAALARAAAARGAGAGFGGVGVGGRARCCSGLVASVTAAGGHVAVIGHAPARAAGRGRDGGAAGRLALIPDPGPDPVEVAAVLLDGMDLVVLGLGGLVGAAVPGACGGGAGPEQRLDPGRHGRALGRRRDAAGSPGARLRRAGQRPSRLGRGGCVSLSLAVCARGAVVPAAHHPSGRAVGAAAGWNGYRRNRCGSSRPLVPGVGVAGGGAVSAGAGAVVSRLAGGRGRGCGAISRRRIRSR